MKQITDDKELAGKVISMTHHSNDELWVSFTDKSFAVYRAADNTVGFGYSQYAVQLVDYEIDKTHEELVILGLVSEFEHKSAVLKQTEEYDKREKEYRETERLRVEKIEREQFDQLSKKYGNK